MNHDNTVTVLLSSYNGEKYLRNQLDSVIFQKDVTVRLIIRDDGSKDGTCKVLKEYAAKYKNITLLLEENIGVEQSFERLSQWAEVNAESQYYAFCDQDDVWFEDKLINSIKAIQSYEHPAVFCCNQVVTNEDLIPLKMMIDDNHYQRLLKVMEVNYFKNRHGCTMLWNKIMHKYLVNVPHSPEYVPAHDKWLMLIGRLVGTVIVSDKPMMYYRQHAHNVYGLTTKIYGKAKKAINRYWIRDNEGSLYANDCIKSIPSHCFESKGGRFVQMVAYYKKNLIIRIKIAFSFQIWGEGIYEGIIHSISVLNGKY